MKKELLAPAGDMASLKAAIHNGADAVYLAGQDFGARKYAKNFSNEELKDAVYEAHLYGVKIYVTVNTIIYEDEIKECLEYIGYLYNIGVDAIIVQDIGLIKLIRKYIPDMEIHASTQAHTHNIEQIKLLESLGVKRVVLARELRIDEINKLETNMELEIFIHGALCISYSGECLFSSCYLNRSGNRGLCAGLCRVPYNLIKDDKTILRDKYLLSPKELNTTNYVEVLKKCKACSFKIEGRMKSPEYVGYVTRIYRKLLDNDNYKLSDEEIFNLKSLYNRGFTKGYLFNATDKDFISMSSSNHQGVLIGEVIGFSKTKIKIKLSWELRQGDAIRLPNNEGMYVNYLYDSNNKLINKANKGDIVLVQNKVGLNALGKVMLTISKALTDDLHNTLEKKIQIKANIYAHPNENLRVSYSDNENVVKKVGAKVEVAKSSPLDKKRIKEILGKLGNTPFVLGSIEFDIGDNIFIPVGVLNEIRRELVEKLIKERTKVERQIKVNYPVVKVCKRSVNKFTISALARSEEQVKALIKNKVDYIYVTDYELYQKYKGENVYFRLERVIRDYKEYKNENLLMGEAGSIKYTSNNKVISDYYLNVVNSSYVKLLNSLGVKRITLSPELTNSRLELLMEQLEGEEVEIIGYGTLEYMIMKYNMKSNLKLSEGKYYLENKSKDKFRIISDNFTHLMSNKKINLIKDIPYYKKIGINTFRLELLDESAWEIDKILEEIKKLLTN